jgi:broad specificity phosphatase PhoE
MDDIGIVPSSRHWQAASFQESPYPNILIVNHGIIIAAFLCTILPFSLKK